MTMEYGLVQGRWWLPHRMYLDATADVGVLGSYPVRFERSYASYSVQGRGEPELAKWRRWLTEAADSPKAQRVDDVVSVVLRLDVGNGRAVELVALVDDGTLLAGAGAGPFTVGGELLAAVRRGNRKRRRGVLPSLG